MASVEESLAIALAHHQAGRLQAAEQIYRQILAVAPHAVDAWHLLGVIALQTNQAAVAIAHLERALQLRPNFAEAHYNLGNAYLQQGQNDEAIACYRRALDLGLQYATAYYHLGCALHRVGNRDDAIAAYRQALVLSPDYSEAHTNLGSALKEQGRLDEAVACYERARQLHPDDPAAHNNLGAAFQKQGKLDEAIDCYRRAVELNPGLAEAHGNLGLALQERGDFPLAALSYRSALQLQPTLAEARFCQSTLLLLTGDWERGLPEFEWRWKTGRMPVRELGQQAWHGQPLQGQRILLHAEQGFGDTIQFVRFAAAIKSQGATTVLACQRSLRNLLTSCPAIDQLICSVDELPAYDLHVPLLSVPGILRTNPQTIPANVPYLFAAAELVAQWRAKLADVPGLRIGINWQGRPDPGPNLRRDIPLDCFAALAQIPGVRLISLQRGAGRNMLSTGIARLPILDLGDDIDTLHGAFMDTAAIMMNLDLVITSDTSIPHLAGALGVPVWLALPFVPDWRWLLERSDSPWYPTMRLFRQTQPGDWDSVFREIQTSLTELLAREVSAARHANDALPPVVE